MNGSKLAKCRLCGLAEVTALLSFVALVAGWLGRYHFLLDIFSHFRFQVTMSLVVCGLIVLAMARKKVLGIAALGTGVVLLIQLGLYYVPQQATRGAKESYRRLMVLNVLTDNRSFERTSNYIRSEDADLVMLFETNRRWKEELLERLGDRYPHHLFGTREDNFGVGVLSKRPLASGSIRFFEGQVLPSIDLIYRDEAVSPTRIIGIHPLPPTTPSAWEARNELLAALADEVVKSPVERVIVGGDFNCSPWSPFFRDLLRETGLEDSARGFGIYPTWTGFSMMLAIPIDHILLSSNLEWTDRKVGPAVGSDHRAVVLDFR